MSKATRKAAVTLYRHDTVYGMDTNEISRHHAAGLLRCCRRSKPNDRGQRALTISRRKVNLNGGHAYIVEVHHISMGRDRITLTATICIGEVPHG